MQILKARKEPKLGGQGNEASPDLTYSRFVSIQGRFSYTTIIRMMKVQGEKSKATTHQFLSPFRMVPSSMVDVSEKLVGVLFGSSVIPKLALVLDSIEIETRVAIWKFDVRKLDVWKSFHNH